MGNIDIAMFKKNIELGKQFILPVPMIEAQSTLEECGMIYNPKEDNYESLEEGDVWKIKDKGDNTILLIPTPTLFDTATNKIIAAPIVNSNELEEDNDKLAGIDLDSPEGKAMDGPAADIA